MVEAGYIKANMLGVNPNLHKEHINKLLIRSWKFIMCFFYIQKKEGATMEDRELERCLKDFTDKICISCKLDCENFPRRSSTY